jgi:hypothetical protein
LNTIAYLKKSLFGLENNIYRLPLGQNQGLWRHFGDTMSPGLGGVFSAYEEGGFSKDSRILELMKMGPFSVG